jgi:hypothetical protein
MLTPTREGMRKQCPPSTMGPLRAALPSSRNGVKLGLTVPTLSLPGYKMKLSFMMLAMGSLLKEHAQLKYIIRYKWIIHFEEKKVKIFYFKNITNTTKFRKIM